MRLPSELARVVQPSLEVVRLEVAAVTRVARLGIRDEAQRLTAKVSSSAQYAADAVQLEQSLKVLSDTAAAMHQYVNQTVTRAEIRTSDT